MIAIPFLLLISPILSFTYFFSSLMDEFLDILIAFILLFYGKFSKTMLKHFYVRELQDKFTHSDESSSGRILIN